MTSKPRQIFKSFFENMQQNGRLMHSYSERRNAEGQGGQRFAHL